MECLGVSSILLFATYILFHIYRNIFIEIVLFLEIELLSNKVCVCMVYFILLRYN